MYFNELSNNQQRLSIDIRQTYDAYREARRYAAKYAGGMSWKTVVLLREKLPHLTLDERAQQMFMKALRTGSGGQLFDL